MDEYRSLGKTQDGYTEIISRSCFECKHMKYKTYTAQSDSGVDNYCFHPDVVIGEIPKCLTGFYTPEWCPILIKNIN